jgi:predicted nuclease of predicted toxin-antitoxin system
VIVWVDAQLSPAIATWLSRTQGVEAVAVRDLGLRDAEDGKIFTAARHAAAVLMTKDQDFVQLLERLGPPPQVIWITCGNTSNQALKEILAAALPTALAMLRDGEPLVEISDAPA